MISCETVQSGLAQNSKLLGKKIAGLRKKWEIPETNCKSKQFFFKIGRIVCPKQVNEILPNADLRF